ncbi:MAG: amidohydrolase family protein, partial [Pseudomonadales bacterium]|nr:amidohydrolase family protein [Pseudomonadales bacterium]
MVVNGLRVALLLVLGFATPLLAADTLISAARLLDVRSGKLLDRPVLLVRDGRIVEIARDGARPAAAADATEIRLDGMTLLPGL